MESLQEQIKNEIHSLERKRPDYIAYLHLKIAERDWHGVADCAMDLRDIEAKIEILKEIKND